MAVAMQAATIRRTVLQGGFAAMPSSAEWKTPTFKLLVFVSSTFTDTQRERNYLMDELIFEMRALAKPLGIQVIFVDMRWGVRDENSSDHKTWIECSNALNWCKAESMGIFFLSLQADKYGYTPLPKTISKESFDRHLSATSCSREHRDLLSKWYQLDTNAQPPEYTLRQLSDHNDSEYWSAFNTMLNAIAGLEFDTQRYGYLRVGHSVTEWEVRAALAPYPIERNLATSIYWSHRKFSVDPADRDFSDTSSNAEAKAKFDELIMYMKSQFGDKLTQTYSPTLTLQDLRDGKDTRSGYQGRDYLESFELAMSKVLKASLEFVAEQKRLWTTDGSGVGLSGEDLEEMLHHLNWAHIKCQSFERREELVKDVIDYIFAKPRTVTAVDGDEQSDDYIKALSLAGVCVSVVGRSGSGKTALMAKLASEAYRIDREEGRASECLEEIKAENSDFSPRPVIIRFCGTSPASRSAKSLVRSICEQIEFIFGLDRRLFLHSPSGGDAVTGRRSSAKIDISYEDLIAYFHNLLAAHPVILFIDSLDQLNDEYQGRSQLTFLKGLKPHSRTRVIVSCLPDEADSQTQTWVYLYLCDTRLNEAKVPRINLIFSSPTTANLKLSAVETKNAEQGSESRLPQNSATDQSVVASTLVPQLPTAQAVSLTNPEVEEAEQLLRQLLIRRGRALTDLQWDLVRKKLAEEPTALYVNLALYIVSQWSSSLVPPVNDSSGENSLLAAGVKNLIHQRFRSLERDYGRKLVRAALGFMTYSVSGISDVEMEDLLSLHEEVLNDVFQYATPLIRRLPSHVWLRLKGALVGLVVEAEGNCSTWYHRQLRETAEVYLEPEKLDLQKILAAYFSNTVDAEVLRSRRINPQEWTICGRNAFDSTSIVNSRRGREASFHLLSTKQWESAEHELCCFEGVCGKVRSGEGFQLVEHVSYLEREVKQLYQAASDTALKQELLPRWTRLQHYMRWLREDISVLNTDCLSQFVFSASSQPVTSIVYVEARLFLKEAVQVMRHGTERHKAVAGLELGSKDDFDALLGKLKGHDGGVVAVAYSPNGAHLASGGMDGSVRLWDAISGSTTMRLDGHRATVTCLSFSPDSTMLASGSEDCIVRLWDLACGTTLLALSGFGDRVLTIYLSCPSADSHLLLTATTGDGQLAVYDIMGGAWLVNTCEEKREAIFAMSVDRNCTKILTGSEDGVVHIWNASDGILEGAFRSHTERINSICFNHDGTQFLSCSTDRRAFVWTFPAADIVLTLEGHKGPVLCGAFLGSVAASTNEGEAASPFVVTSSWDRTIRLWGATGDAIAVLHGHDKGVYSVAVSPHGGTIASASGDGSLHIWDLSYVKPSTSSENSCENLNAGHTKAVTSVAISPNGLFAASASADGSVRFWDTSSGKCLSLLPSHSNKAVNSVVFSLNGEWIATGSEDSKIRLWKSDFLSRPEGRVSDGDITLLNGHKRSITCVSFSADSSMLASSSVDCHVRIWSVGQADNIEGRPLQKHSDRVNSVAFSLTGKHVITSCDYTVYIQDVASGAEVAKFQGHMWFATCAAFIQCSLTGNDGVDGALQTLLAVSSSDDKSLQVWDVAHGSKHYYLHRLMGHTGRVCHVTVSDTGVLASASWDCTARLWDHTGRSLAVLPGHSTRVNAVHFSRSRSPTESQSTDMNDIATVQVPELLISGSEDGKVRIWLLDLLNLPPVGQVTAAGVEEQVRQQLEAHKEEWLIHGVDKL